MKISWHKMNLVSAFKGNPSNYHFLHSFASKTMTSCACGHAIKNIFIVRNDELGHEVRLGSECIFQYAELDHVAQEIDKWNEQRKIEEEQRKEAEFNALYIDAFEASKNILNMVCMGVFVSPKAFSMRFLPETKKYKKIETKIKKLKEVIEVAKAAELEHAAEYAEKKAAKEAKEQAKIARQEAIVAKKLASKHIGNIGDRIEVGGEVVFCEDIRTQFGHMRIVKIEFEGNAIVTKSSNLYDYNFSKGRIVKFSGKVAEHSVYKDEKQTRLTHLKNIEFIDLGKEIEYTGEVREII